MGSELVMALDRLGVIVLVLVVVLGLIGDLGGDEDIAKGVRVGVELKAVDHQAVRLGVGIDREGELEMAGVMFIVLLVVLLVVLLEDGWAAWAIQADGLRLGEGYAFDRDGVDNLYIVGAQFGIDEESVGGGRQPSCSDERSEKHCCGMDNVRDQWMDRWISEGNGNKSRKWSEGNVVFTERTMTVERKKEERGNVRLKRVVGCHNMRMEESA